MASSNAKPSLLRFLKAYILTGRILTRYLTLFLLRKIFGKNRFKNLWERTHRISARKIKVTILDLKGLFIKVGQMMSIMTQFLPEPITQELEGLQDAVPPAPYDDIEKRFREEFGKAPLEVFKKFEKQPLASASLGQVHEAVSHDGKKLAVKVQYPGIEEIVQSDLKILKRIYGLLNLLFPQYGLKKTYAEVREVILDELDFQSESRNLEILKNNLAEEKDFLFPTVYQEFSTSRVLTLEYMEGVKISNLVGLNTLGISPTDVAKKIIHVYCKQIFIDGIYHADPHPGNFLVQAVEREMEVFSPNPEGSPEAVEKIKSVKRMAPRIVMMDFGAVAKISDKMREGIARFLEGVIRRDTQIISKAMKNMGFISKTQNEEVFDKIVEFFYERLKDVKIEEIKNFQVGSMQNIEDLLEFRKLDISFKDLFQSFNVPKEWALLERTLILLMGLTTHLDPKLNPMTIIIPYAEQFVLGKDRTFADVIIETVKEVALSYLKLPSELERTLKKLNQGEIEIYDKAAAEASRRLSRALNRLTYGGLALGSAFLAHVLEQGGFLYYTWGYGLSGLFGFLFLWSFIRKK
jgi:ubiquinone biosynthesis protein